MIRRSLLSRLLGLVLLLGAGPAFAQDAATPLPAGVRVALVTDLGTILVETDPRAPLTSANFLRYVDQRRFDGLTFYRAMQLGPDAGLIQGGASGARDRILPPVAHEPTSQTGLTHTDGALSMAQNQPGTATADFFIIVGSLTSLDAGKTTPDDPGYAVFGHVVEGMEVVRAILAAPTSATEGEGVMRGQMLAPRIRILSARRVETSAP
ncbi:MAG TPA: peptidylprolyl isomerase [Brevundimonas sp.]|nr:peptidylprolyl isomerase [Brevundimonas sp.]